MLTVVLGSDHAGYPLKEEIKVYLNNKKIQYIDCGTNSGDSCDYTVFAKKTCDKVISGEADLGILCCGTGVGMSIAANKVKGIRASCCSDCFSAKLSRMHNNANVLCLGARVVGAGLACELVNAFLNTPFEGGERHIRRIAQISALENGEL